RRVRKIGSIEKAKELRAKFQPARFPLQRDTLSQAVHLNPDIPQQFGDIITKALEKDRKLRYQNASDLRVDLRRAKRDSTDAARPAIIDRGGRRGQKVVIGLAVF